MTTFDDDAYAIAAIQQDALGYFLKDTALEELAYTIRVIFEGTLKNHVTISWRN